LTVVVAHMTYDTFGRVWTSTTPSTEFHFAFTGRDLDPESDLYHYRARYYDPATGQFISADPIGFEAGDGNLYRYVGNGPIDRTDPSGLFTLGDISDETLAFLLSNPDVGGTFVREHGLRYLELLDLAIRSHWKVDIRDTWDEAADRGSMTITIDTHSGIFSSSRNSIHDQARQLRLVLEELDAKGLITPGGQCPVPRAGDIGTWCAPDKSQGIALEQAKSQAAQLGGDVAKDIVIEIATGPLPFSFARKLDDVAELRRLARSDQARIPGDGLLLWVFRTRKGLSKPQLLFRNKNDAMNWASKHLGPGKKRLYNSRGAWEGWIDDAGNTVKWNHHDWYRGDGLSKFPHLNFSFAQGNQQGHLFLLDKIDRQGMRQRFVEELVYEILK
jgi:RHS repeat-associated protein